MSSSMGLSEQTAIIAAAHHMVNVTLAPKTSTEKGWHTPRRCFSCAALTSHPSEKDILLTADSMATSQTQVTALPGLYNRSSDVRLSAVRKQSSNHPPHSSSKCLDERPDASSLIKGACAASSCPTGCCPTNCCMPPPCNQPPKCLQNMTGYYHYPYGFWFCGPYNVNTGPVPCDGPVRPGGPCGPVAGPCPNFHGMCPCKTCPPCGPCAPSGACVPCGPCGLCGICGLCHTPSAQSGMGYSHNCASCGLHTNATYWRTPHQPSIPVDASTISQAASTNMSTRHGPVGSCPEPEVLTESLATEQPSSKVSYETLGGLPPSGSIKIDPDFVKKYPFNKPTFKPRETTGTRSL
ncbi:unnamed protein product, partial [Iphiclides podalirius]